MRRYFRPRFVTVFIALAAFTASFGAARAAQPLVDAAWLAAHSCDAGVAVIDIRDNPRAFQRARVPCARHAPFAGAGWTVKIDGVPGMLPTSEALGALFGGIGLSNADHAVIVSDGGSVSAMVPATRAFWTLKAAGHNMVSLLDGGFDAYRRDRDNPVEKGEATPPAATSYLVALNTAVIANADDVAASIDGGTALVDDRESDYFMGINKRPSVARAGTLPGARNLPISWLTAPDGRFHSPDALMRITKAAGLETDGAQINFCNSGRMASLGWFVAHELLGNDQARVYDGSMAEWTAKDDRPVEQAVEMP
jgi:thiosulfate/3-mercaptopyruvate sulfurtransferase